ncbi:MAG: DUF6168 family protein [Flavobacterium sp.]
MIKKITRLFVYLVPVTVLFYFIQEFILSTYFNHIEFKIATLSIYLFHFLTVAVSYTLLVLVNKYFFQQTGYAFLAFGIIKMGLSVFFLMPVIDSDIANKIPDVLSFFIPFFIFLLLETIFSVNLLNSSDLKEN